MSNMWSKQDIFISITLLIIVAPILKVVRNLFQTFYLVDLDITIGSDLQQLYVHCLKTVCCPLPSEWCQNPVGSHLFLG